MVNTSSHSQEDIIYVFLNSAGVVKIHIAMASNLLAMVSNLRRTMASNLRAVASKVHSPGLTSQFLWDIKITCGRLTRCLKKEESLLRVHLGVNLMFCSYEWIALMVLSIAVATNHMVWPQPTPSRLYGRICEHCYAIFISNFCTKKKRLCGSRIGIGSCC